MQGPAAPDPPADPGTPSDGLDTAGTLLHCCWPGIGLEGMGEDTREYRLNI